MTDKAYIVANEQQVVHANQNKQPRVERLRARMKMKKWVGLKDLNEFAESRGYRDWIEFRTYEEPETVREARKMIERSY